MKPALSVGGRTDSAHNPPVRCDGSGTPEVGARSVSLKPYGFNRERKSEAGRLFILSYNNTFAGAGPVVSSA
jgi:hypothetical protein